MTTQSLFIYITTATKEEALMIARQLVTQQLAACANIITGMSSVYRWKNQIIEDQETVLVLKSTSDLFDAISERVTELHSYECPCIIALPIDKGNEPYLCWINEQTHLQ